MASIAIGPVGALHRGEIRRIAVLSGVTLTEGRSLLQSTFRATGTAAAVTAFGRAVQALKRRLDAMDHEDYVREVEDAERRRAWWGRLLGRSVRREPMTRDETAAALALLSRASREVLPVPEVRRDECRDADDRLLHNVHNLGEHLSIDDARGDAEASVAGVFAAVSMRYLQHDVRKGGIALPKELRRQVLGTSVTIDTWE